MLAPAAGEVGTVVPAVPSMMVAARLLLIVSAVAVPEAVSPVLPISPPALPVSALTRASSRTDLAAASALLSSVVSAILLTISV